jgi:hypothetical protein
MTRLHFMGIKNILSPLDNGGLWDGNQIFSVGNQHTPTIGWQLKFFGH